MYETRISNRSLIGIVIMKHYTSIVTLLACSCLFYSSSIAGDETPSLDAAIQVRLQDGVLSLRSEHASLEEIVQAVARAAGIKLCFHGELPKQAGAWRLGPTSLEDGLRQLLDEHSLTLVYKQDRGRSVLQKLYVIPRLEAAPAQALHLSLPVADAGHKDMTRDEREVRLQLAEIARLAGLRGNDVLHRLESYLHRDADREVRRQAVLALQELGGPESVDALLKGLGDPDPDLRAAVVEALGHIGGDEAIMAIGQTIVGDPDPIARRAAVNALAGHRGGAVEAFVQAASKDRSEQVRLAVARLVSGQ